MGNSLRSDNPIGLANGGDGSPLSFSCGSLQSRRSTHLPLQKGSTSFCFFSALYFIPSSASQFLPRQSRDYKVRRKRNAIGEKDIYESKGYYGGVSGIQPITPPGCR